jgi:hypothetical protein
MFSTQGSFGLRVSMVNGDMREMTVKTHLFQSGLLFVLIIALSGSFGCKKDKKKSTTPDKTAAKSECNCPQIRVCAKEEAIARVKNRCENWQKEFAKSSNAAAPTLKREGTLACREVDMNGDGLVDIHYFYDASGSNILEIQQDTGRDGIIDVVRTYRSGMLFVEKYNNDADETTWEVIKTYSNGVITQIASRVINSQSTGQKICPGHNYFENFDEKGLLVTISYDTDCDGRVDFVINKEGKNAMNLQLKEQDTVIKLKETKPATP